MLLQLTPPSQLREEYKSVMAAFMRSCDDGHLRLGIFNLFVYFAVEGRIQLKLEDLYYQLVKRYLFRNPYDHAYDLARRPCFRVAALYDGACCITPLGCFICSAYNQCLKCKERSGGTPLHFPPLSSLSLPSPPSPSLPSPP